uniref:Uncharacterized protein n=1 Tax=Oryzias latipes TaxID=8090 RepID=A0A3B3H900_ORYLA
SKRGVHSWTNRGLGGGVGGGLERWGGGGSSPGGPDSCLGLGDARDAWVVVGCLSGAWCAPLGRGTSLGPLGAVGGLLYGSGWGLHLLPPVPPCFSGVGGQRACFHRTSCFSGFHYKHNVHL